MQVLSAKSYFPRSLYARATLILLVPVLMLQLIVSVVFIQRHYEGVTQQMTRNVVREVQLLLDRVDAADTIPEALAAVAPVADPLSFSLILPSEVPDNDALFFYDLSARAMMATMRAAIPDVIRFDMTIDREVWVWVDTRHGPLAAMFERRRVSASNPHQLLVLMVFAGLILTLISVMFMRSQVRPIKRLAEVSEAFGKGQTVAYRPDGAAEVRAAGQAFVAMRARIERQIEQRTMMLSSISHDLRTPLTRLKLGLAMQEQTEDIEAMLRDVTDMERLVDEFLAFSRGDTLDDAEEVLPLDLVDGIVMRFRKTGAALHLEESGAPSAMTLHPLAVSRAVENLIGNAIKFGTKAFIRLEHGAKSLRITVEDNGPGIPADQREDALKPFVQLDSARNQDRGSSVGLGLAIAHDIARRHGGALDLGESARLGGLSATLTLAR